MDEWANKHEWTVGKGVGRSAIDSMGRHFCALPYCTIVNWVAHVYENSIHIAKKIGEAEWLRIHALITPPHDRYSHT